MIKTTRVDKNVKSKGNIIFRQLLSKYRTQGISTESGLRRFLNIYDSTDSTNTVKIFSSFSSLRLNSFAFS